MHGPQAWGDRQETRVAKGHDQSARKTGNRLQLLGPRFNGVAADRVEPRAPPGIGLPRGHERHGLAILPPEFDGVPQLGVGPADPSEG